MLQPQLSDNPVTRLSFELSLQVMEFVEEMERARRFVLAQQVLRSATSVGASIRESQHAESRADFIHKCKVAAKEAEETEYWLLLCQHAPSYPTPSAAVFDTLQQVRCASS
ncbi:four helix bundle protein [Hymenobacter weizhouensis]|uniref:four helix bundle protein n=1 Tax=Hymenobacter sp. YIM 151500-1 TaxID=2987689 RepID=UPI002226CC3A|nr:four helix bundle protein [Hymenobacter sp. YIM 151500-1]UYZ62008.1 four helix bundle protein [Hymenobacter sp. YIM 151500-1]